MDRAKLDAMKTINVTINSNLASSTTPVLLYRYAHGYTYPPQFWGLWDITYASGILGGVKKRGYGYIVHNTGFGLTASFYYTVDSTYINLYFLFNTTSGATTSGTVAKFTGYVFANSREPQNYTV